MKSTNPLSSGSSLTRHWRTFGACLLLASCGGSGGDVSQSPQNAASDNPPAQVNSANTPPTISGSPPSAVLRDTPYLFVPNAADVEGDSLSFSASNIPPWATFDPSTGRLEGTPSGADLGSYPDILISVTDGETTSTLTAFTITVLATATGSATLSWTPPTTNANGSPLDDLAGYRIYWGTSPGTHPNNQTVNNPGLASYVVDNLLPGTYYFVATAFDASGNESVPSNEASKIVQ